MGWWMLDKKFKCSSSWKFLVHVSDEKAYPVAHAWGILESFI